MFIKEDAGLEIEVKNARLYPTYDSRNSSKIISGTYYIYESTVKNNRVRVTDSKDKVGKPCAMSGWIDIKFIDIKDQTPVEE